MIAGADAAEDAVPGAGVSPSCVSETAMAETNGFALVTRELDGIAEKVPADSSSSLL